MEIGAPDEQPMIEILPTKEPVPEREKVPAGPPAKDDD